MISNKRKWALMLMLTGLVAVYAQGPNGTETYYKSASNKKGAALKTALCNIIKVTSQDVESYDGLTEAYENTDRMTNGYIRDRYSKISKFTSINTGSNKYEGGMCNKEHSFPKSWFGGKVKPMYSDIVHVVPSDALVNNRRGNLPFGENNGDTFKSALYEAGDEGGYSKVGKCTVSGFSGDCFEPNDEWKGDFARIYFYMITCYENYVTGWVDTCPMFKSNATAYQPFSDWAFNMLMRWAAEDPVSDIEIARQAGIEKTQGNRNPFVDYPGLEQYIWGSRVNETFYYDNYDGSVVNYVAAPVLTATADATGESSTVTMTTTTDGATIYYTTDGTTPTTQSTRYTTPVVITAATTFMAIAVKDGNQSSVTTQTVTVGGSTPVNPTGDNIYVKVTSNNQLESGCRYLLVYEESATAGQAYNGFTSKQGTPGAVAIDNATIDLTNDANGIIPLTLEQLASGKWTITDGDGYFALTSKSNALNKATDASDANAQWTITATTITNASYTGYTLQYNTSAKMFRCYTGGQKAVVLYKEVVTETPETIDVEIGDTSYATLYYGEKNLIVPGDIEAYTYYISEEGRLEESYVYGPNEIIPAGTGVVLQSLTGAGTFTFTVTDQSGDEDPDNQLRGSDVDERTSGGSYYYMLSLDAQKTPGSVGFYWGAEGGASFVNQAHRAYLPVNAVGDAKPCYLFEDNTTGIRPALNSSPRKGSSTAVYDLQGRRVTEGQNGSSLYIRDGKKIAIK
ncbi:MAG: endonuclease [Prevotella sp.]|nr:endonuclease [Prevotella sp.]